MNKESILKCVVYLLTGLGLVIGGYLIIQYANSIKPMPSFKEYSFQVGVYPFVNQLNQFIINYDFESKKGNISFLLSSKIFQSVEIYIPKGLAIGNRDISSEVWTDYPEDGDYTVIEDYENNLSNLIKINSINKNGIFADRIYLELIGDSSFEPNGLFRIFVKNPAKGGYLHTFLNFDLGYYECSINCFVDYNNIMGYIQEGNNIKVYMKNTDDKQERMIGSVWFVLNSINKDKLIKKQRWDNISIAMIVGGLILLIELIVVAMGFIYHKPRYIKCNKGFKNKKGVPLLSVKKNTKFKWK